MEKHTEQSRTKTAERLETEKDEKKSLKISGEWSQERILNSKIIS